MRLRIPGHPARRYLSGIDWLMTALDHASRRQSGLGNNFLVALKLAGRLDPDATRERIEAICRHLPLLDGKAARDITLAPYWRIPSAADPLGRLEIATAKQTETAVGIINSPLPHRRSRIRFRTIETDNGNSLFTATFSHTLFDARGAETFLKLIDDGGIPDPLEAQDADLEGWEDKFRAGKTLNRMLIAIRRANPVTLPRSTALTGRNSRFELIEFDVEDSERFLERAYAQAGYLMVMPFVLAIAIRAFHRAIGPRAVSGASYVIPVTLDARPPRVEPRHTFFNHLSFLFITVDRAEAEDLSATIASIRNQLYDLTKLRFANSVQQASALGRIAPRSILTHLIRLPLKGEFGSFSFSYLGDSAYGKREFLGLEVENLFHLPRVPVPPGLGIFLCRFDDRFNLTVSCAQGLLTDQEMETLVGNLRQMGQ